LNQSQRRNLHRAIDAITPDLPVTTIEKAISQLLEETGRVGLARGALKDARKQGYISAGKASALTRRLSTRERDTRGERGESLAHGPEAG
jgi:hypothetical protein